MQIKFAKSKKLIQPKDAISQITLNIIKWKLYPRTFTTNLLYFIMRELQITFLLITGKLEKNSPFIAAQRIKNFEIIWNLELWRI